MAAWRTRHRPLALLFNNTSRDSSSRLPGNTLDDIDMHMLRSLRRATAAGPKGTDLYGLVLEMGGFPYLAKHKLKTTDVLVKSSRLHSLGLATGSLKGEGRHIQDTEAVQAWSDSPGVRPARGREGAGGAACRVRDKIAHSKDWNEEGRGQVQELKTFPVSLSVKVSWNRCSIIAQAL